AENGLKYESAKRIYTEMTSQKDEGPVVQEKIKKLSPVQALIISGYTGFVACNTAALRADIEKRLGGPVGNITLGGVSDKICNLYKNDFSNLCPHAHPESENKLTEGQAIIVTGYTGKLLGDVDKFYADLEKRLGRKIVNEELPAIGQEKISALYKEDFQSLVL
ncbi:hypothetical protein QTP17_29745, partial [Klebsiella pasteurii]|uniref:DUF7736 domain-containing protein n=1 Tax=Klebsiella pasteurii TaxID=2587529 RepID=UPI0025930892